ncbi:MAG TPA: 50S ribosomal protein L29 [Candidatus Paceibacterota bacterium]|nr:50S ribosomal protein L29 [Candidatus Paceibacterota bacterium]
MKKKEIQDMKNKPAAELERLVQDGNEQLRAMRFDLAAGKVKDISKVRELRRKIARAKTFLNKHANGN